MEEIEEAPVIENHLINKVYFDKNEVKEVTFNNCGYFHFTVGILSEIR